MENTDNETWRPDERPDVLPTAPYDPFKPDEQRAPVPLPPDAQPQPEVPGPKPQPAPAIDPPTGEPKRL